MVVPKDHSNNLIDQMTIMYKCVHFFFSNPTPIVHLSLQNKLFVMANSRPDHVARKSEPFSNCLKEFILILELF
jgi:hypothetical protein